MRFTQVIAFVALVLFSSAVVSAQTPSARRQLDDAAAIEEPNERIAALKEFISRTPGQQLLTAAREQLVLAWAQVGERHLGANNISAASEAFRSAVAELPDQISDKFFQDTVARMPFVMSARGYRTEAIDLAKLLEPRLTREPLRLGALGEFYINLEAPGEAIRVLEMAVKRAPDEIRLHRPLATAYRMSLRLADATKELEQVAALDASDGRAYGELGNLARARGDYPEALRLYRSQLRIDERSTAAMKGVALSLIATGKDDEGKAEIARIRQTKGAQEIDSDLHFLTQMAFYYLARGKNDEAADVGVRVLALEPRYAWGRILAAEIEMATGEPFEAEKHLIAALKNADFPTLRFTLGRLYLSVEDFDGALEQFAKFITLTSGGKFKTRLGGVLEAEATGLSELLARERQASIFVAVPPTPEEQFAMAEALIRFDARLRTGKALPAPSSSLVAPRRTRTVREAPATVEALTTAFVEAVGVRRPFRALYAARRLAEEGQSPQLALKLADQVLDQAEIATEPEGSLLDFPNYDRVARLRILRGRALDTKGWALSQLKRNKEAMTALAEAVDSFGGFPEAKASVWRLGTVREVVGEEEEALNLYIAAYEPPTQPGSVDVRRTLIEVLYRKVHGSLEGLDARIGPAPKSTITSTTGPAPDSATASPVSTPIVELPTADPRMTELATRTSSAAVRGGRFGATLLVKSTAPRPSTIAKPEVVDAGTSADVRTAAADEALRLAEKPDQAVAPALPLRRMSKSVLRWPVSNVDDGAPFPVPSPKAVDLIELAEREAPKFALKKPNARVLRRPSIPATEPAIPPSQVELVAETVPVEKEPAPSSGSTRPRTVESTRPRRVEKP
jgi:tetratricopeptide (TPR) repeat protein